MWCSLVLFIPRALKQRLDRAKDAVTGLTVRTQEEEKKRKAIMSTLETMVCLIQACSVLLFGPSHAHFLQERTVSDKRDEIDLAKEQAKKQKAVSKRLLLC